MSTFSRKTFDAAAYLAFRPSYPRWVYDKVLTYHFGGTRRKVGGLALDLGCGPGVSTLSLLPHFERVIGIDASEQMVSVAITPETRGLPAELLPESQDGLGKLEYRQGYSEQLDFLQDASVDLVTCGQAAHWFDYPLFWKTMTRVLKPGGSVCLYGYPDFFLPDFPSTRSLLNRFSLKDGQAPACPESEPTEHIDSIADFWEQPGRSLVNQGLQPVPFPTTYAELARYWNASSALKRTFSTIGLPQHQIWPSWPPLTTAPLEAELDDHVKSEFQGEQSHATMDKLLNWSQLASYLRTWSATHTYLQQHPEQSQNGAPDVVDRFVLQLRNHIKKANGGNDVDQLHLRWPLCFVMIKKK